jgi:hypothetical protein
MDLFLTFQSSSGTWSLNNSTNIIYGLIPCILTMANLYLNLFLQNSNILYAVFIRLM